MSAIQSISYQCDHCGFICKSDEGDGDKDWLHADRIPYGLDIHDFDLCPNCVSELKAWFRAGPQHAEERKRQQMAAALSGTKRREFARHGAGNARGFHGLLGELERMPGDDFDNHH